jgi:hypothetical protein
MCVETVYTFSDAFIIYNILYLSSRYILNKIISILYTDLYRSLFSSLYVAHNSRSFFLYTYTYPVFASSIQKFWVQKHRNFLSYISNIIYISVKKVSPARAR